MNIVVSLILLIAAVILAEPVAFNETEHVQQAIAGDLSLKMLMAEDGSARGKCYCSCELNARPVFMELAAGTDLATLA